MKLQNISALKNLKPRQMVRFAVAGTLAYSATICPYALLLVPVWAVVEVIFGFPERDSRGDLS